MKRIKIKLNKRTKRLIISAILAIIISLSGVGVANKEALGQYLDSSQPGLYQVVNVDDGDTITVIYSGKEERVRFIGIDTPETHHPKKPVQCFGLAAKDFTSKLIGQNKVRLEADPEDDNRDIYGRLLRYVYLPDGTHVNAEIVRQGYGFAYTHFPFTKLEEMRALEREARAERRGLWAGCQIEEEGDSKSTNPA